VTVLATAATGTTGRAVVHALLAAGQEVRALTRNPATADLPDVVDVGRGDLDRPEDLVAVLDGVDRVYHLPAVVHHERAVDRADDFLALAVESGLRRVVTLTGSAVTTRRPGSFEVLLQVEQRVEASGLEWTHVRPHEFAVNKLDVWAHSVRAEGVVRNAFPDGTGVPVHEADIAEYVLCYRAEFAEEPPEVSPDFERVTGRPGRTLAQWARDHRMDFE
jgi:uncharacterized protein YbjT (DUF2867 family)